MRDWLPDGCGAVSSCYSGVCCPKGSRGQAQREGECAQVSAADGTRDSEVHSTGPDSGTQHAAGHIQRLQAEFHLCQPFHFETFSSSVVAAIYFIQSPRIT